MTKKFFFPVVHPPKKHGVGYAEVFVWSDREKPLPPESHFPHQRFFLDRVIRAWEILKQPCLWPDAVLGWSPHSVDEEICPPQQWQGPSANLSTLLAVAHHCQPFQHKRLQTQHIWATGCVSAQGTLEAANQFATKAQFFLKHSQQTGIHGIFIAPLEHQPILAHPHQHGLEHIPYRVQIFDPQLKTISTRESSVFLLLPQQSASIAQFLRWAQGDSTQTKQALYASLAVLCCCLLFAWFWFRPSVSTNSFHQSLANSSNKPKAHTPLNSPHHRALGIQTPPFDAKNSTTQEKLSRSIPKTSGTPSNSFVSVSSLQPRTMSAQIPPKSPNQPKQTLHRTKRTMLRKPRKQRGHFSPHKRHSIKTRLIKPPSLAKSSKHPQQLALETPPAPSQHQIPPMTPSKKAVDHRCPILFEVHPITAEVTVEPNDPFTKPEKGTFCFSANTKTIVIRAEGMQDCVIALAQVSSTSSNHSNRRYQAVLRRDSQRPSGTVAPDYCTRSLRLVRK